MKIFFYSVSITHLEKYSLEKKSLKTSLSKFNWKDHNRLLNDGLPHTVYMTICPIMLEFIALIFVFIEKMIFKNKHDKYSPEKKVKTSLSLLYRTPCFSLGREGCHVDLFSHSHVARECVCERCNTMLFKLQGWECNN